MTACVPCVGTGLSLLVVVDPPIPKKPLRPSKNPLLLVLMVEAAVGFS